MNTQWHDTWRDIRADLHRYRGNSSLKSFRKALGTPGFHYLFVWRLARYYWLRKTPFLSWYLQKRLARLKLRYGINIPVSASLGPGCRINHYGTIVLNSQTKAGANLTLSQGVTIGHSLAGKRKGCPTVGDNVFFAPGAIAIGGITIGDGAAIGAGSTAFRDIPAGGVVVGSPGRLVSRNGAAEYIVNPWSPPAEKEAE